MPSRTPQDPRWDRVVLALDPVRIAATVDTLHRRIEERFPDSGLGRVCAELHRVAKRTHDRLDRITRPNLVLRGATWIMAALLVVGVAAVLARLELPGGVTSAAALLATLESAVQDAVFVGIAVVFLVTAENRLKRRAALRFIRELRAFAHVVDMHQLTKDPDRILHPGVPDTRSSPTRTLTREELGRYLDYCAEMLSLTSKVAALYGERFDDAVVLQAVDEVETLTSGLSGKIWQKIMILDGP